MIREVNAQEWLNKNYPRKKRREVKLLNINKKGLTGNLRIEGFISVNSLNCNDNELDSLSIMNCPLLTSVSCCRSKLTSLRILSCPQISELRCSDNSLTNINLSGLDTKEIKKIDLSNNNLSQEVLSSLDNFTKLGVCILDNNRPQLVQQPKSDDLKEKAKQLEKQMGNDTLLKEEKIERLEENNSLLLNQNAFLNEEKTSLQKDLQELAQLNNSLKKKLRKVNDELAVTRKEIRILRKENAELKIKPKEAEMENLMTGFKNKVDENNCENLETLLETWDEILVKDDSKFIQKYFQAAKSNLSKQLTEIEIQSLLEKRKELFELKKLLSQNQELEVESEVPTLNISLQQLINDYNGK